VRRATKQDIDIKILRQMFQLKQNMLNKIFSKAENNRSNAWLFLSLNNVRRMAKLKVLLSFNMKLIPTCSEKRFTLGFPLAPAGHRALSVTLGSR